MWVISGKDRALVAFSFYHFSAYAKSFARHLEHINDYGIRLFCVKEDRFIHVEDVIEVDDARRMIVENMPWLSPLPLEAVRT